MDNLVVIKTDIPIDCNLMSGIAKATKATVVILPMRCTITSGDDALRELQNYKEVLEKFCK